MLSDNLIGDLDSFLSEDSEEKNNSGKNGKRLLGEQSEDIINRFLFGEDNKRVEVEILVQVVAQNVVKIGSINDQNSIKDAIIEAGGCIFESNHSVHGDGKSIGEILDGVNIVNESRPHAKINDIFDEYEHHGDILRISEHENEKK